MDQAFQRACTALRLCPEAVPQWPVGLLSVTEGVISQLDQHKAVGLCGMAGIGKTTIASAVFHQMRRRFERHFFLHIGQAKGDKLKDIQRQFLQRLTAAVAPDAPPERHIGHQQLAAHIRFRLQQSEMLIVLDDVCSKEQLEHLLGPCHKSSCVLITSRNQGLLLNVWPYISCCPIICQHVANLAESSSQRLFNLLAFSTPSAPDSLSSKAKTASQVCNGLPMSIQAMATCLAANGPTAQAASWASAAEWLWNAHLPGQALFSRPCSDALREYLNLNPRLRTMFMDIAWFMHGQPVTDAVHLWGRHGEVMLRPLLDVSLVQISCGILNMHWHLRSRARARLAESSYPSSAQYLWFPSAPTMSAAAAQVRHLPVHQ